MSSGVHRGHYSDGMHVRPAAIAGLFYAGDANVLRRDVRGYIDAAPSSDLRPKALVAPHAGTIYSGPTAGYAYKLIPSSIARVVLLGPAHRVAVRGLAAPSVDAFDTPLGRVRLDRETITSVLELPQVHVDDRPHAQEHSLEIHLPFLQERLGDGFELVPFVVGDASAEEVAEVLDRLWGGPETLILISSDLSHFHDYDTARRIDAETTRAIEALEPERLDRESACGRIPLSGLLLLAKRRGMKAHTLDVRSSGDTAGTPERVVGYGSYAFV